MLLAIIKKQLEKEQLEQYVNECLDMIKNQEEQKIKFKKLIAKIEKLDIE